MKEERIRGAGLLADCLSRYLPALSPSNSRRYRLNAVYIYPKTFGLKIERDFCANVRGCFAVLSGETATLARVLRATDAYSIAWGKLYFVSTTTSRSQSHQLKAAEANLTVLQEMRKGSGVLG